MIKKVGLKRTLINIAITAVIGFIYYYNKLPAINLHDPSFYGFFFILVLIYCLLTVISMGGVKSATDARSFFSSLKQFCRIPLIICGALIVIYLIGALLSSPLLRASAYKSLLPIKDGNFVQDVTEIGFDQIPMLDEDSAMKLGDKKLGELSDMVSQFEVADNYTQINYKSHPVRVTPLKYGDIIKWFNNR
ncbi:MAG: CvpA family protein, partial [Bacillota bacterium]|nr:CvpA family protein [Bacillota bacterium]